MRAIDAQHRSADLEIPSRPPSEARINAARERLYLFPTSEEPKLEPAAPSSADPSSAGHVNVFV